MANDILYDLTPWEDAPSTLTPINAENLNARDGLLKKVVDKTNQLQEQILDYENLRKELAMTVKTVNGNAPDEDGNVEVYSEEAQLEVLIETDMLPAVHNTEGAILTDENGQIVLRY